MSLKFLNSTPDRALKKVTRDLVTINPIYVEKIQHLKKLSIRELSEQQVKLEKAAKKKIMESSYGSWLKDDSYVETQLLKEFVILLKEYRQEQVKKTKLVPGYVYYKSTKQFGPILEGQRYYHRDGDNQYRGWTKFSTPIAVAKALEVIRHGTEDDFRKIYVEMADGDVSGLEKVNLRHITESTKSALKDIEEYCDSRWAGPWPWESNSPWLLKVRLEENRKMRNRVINEMHYQFGELLEHLFEDEMDKFELIGKSREMVAHVDKMIADLGKISGESIEASAAYGEHASQLGSTIQQPLNAAAKALSDLKAAVEQAVANIEGGEGSMGGDFDMDDDLGSPEDAMGDMPDMGDDGDLSDTLSDLDLEGSDERPKKEI